MLTASFSREFPPDDARDWSLWADQPPRHTLSPCARFGSEDVEPEGRRANHAAGSPWDCGTGRGEGHEAAAADVVVQVPVALGALVHVQRCGVVTPGPHDVPGRELGGSDGRMQDRALLRRGAKG